MNTRETPALYLRTIDMQDEKPTIRHLRIQPGQAAIINSDGYFCISEEELALSLQTNSYAVATESGNLLTFPYTPGTRILYYDFAMQRVEMKYRDRDPETGQEFWADETSFTLTPQYQSYTNQFFHMGLFQGTEGDYITIYNRVDYNYAYMNPQ